MTDVPSPPFRDLRDVEAFVAGDRGLTFLFAEAKRGLGDDPAHDARHVLRVGLWTTRLIPDATPPRLSVAAALLHDVVNPPKDSPLRSKASELSAERAFDLLPKAGFDAAETALGAEAIRTHSFSRGETPKSPLGDALQDADRLEALGALGLFRLIATGVRLNSALFDQDDPWARRRPLDDRRFGVDHLFTKLFKIPEAMRTPLGAAEARRRVLLLRAFATALGEEIGVPAPAAGDA
jgi:uncharacterized protein